MGKQTIADKMAEKTFLSEGFQSQWRMHLRAFGPILAPAFVEKYQALVHLTAALNLISNGKIKDGLNKLQLVEKYISCDADRAAWLFCHGLAYEMGGQHQQMAAYYVAAGALKPKFWWPYVKAGKYLYQCGDLEAAAEQFILATESCEGQDLSKDLQTLTVMGSVYTNLCSVLTQLHRYDEAEAALEQSKQLLPGLPGRAATEAILRAAQGHREAAEEALQRVKQETPMVWEATAQTVEDILCGRHPEFSEGET